MYFWYLNRECWWNHSKYTLFAKSHFGDTIEFMSRSVLRPNTKNEEEDELFQIIFAAEDGAACKKRYSHFLYWSTAAPWAVRGKYFITPYLGNESRSPKKAGGTPCLQGLALPASFLYMHQATAPFKAMLKSFSAMYDQCTPSRSVQMANVVYLK